MFPNRPPDAIDQAIASFQRAIRQPPIPVRATGRNLVDQSPAELRRRELPPEEAINLPRRPVRPARTDLSGPGASAPWTSAAPTPQDSALATRGPVAAIQPYAGIPQGWNLGPQGMAAPAWFAAQPMAATQPDWHAVANALNGIQHAIATIQSASTQPPNLVSPPGQGGRAADATHLADLGRHPLPPQDDGHLLRRASAMTWSPAQELAQAGPSRNRATPGEDRGQAETARTEPLEPATARPARLAAQPTEPTPADWLAIAQVLEDEPRHRTTSAPRSPAQDPAPAPTHDPTEADLVAIDVAVNDTDGQPVSAQRAAELDAARQRRPLHRQIQKIYEKAHKPPPRDIRALDNEPHAQVFARLLSRLLQGSDNNDATGQQRRHQLLNDCMAVIEAILPDQELRAEVFAMAINALGSCGDGVYKGFSDIVHATHIHQMKTRITSGSLSTSEFAEWGRREFRLHKLQELTMAHIQSKLLTSTERATAWAYENEPLQLMLRAEVLAGKHLALPASACQHVSRCFEREMPEITVKEIARAVRHAERQQGQLHEFLMSNPVWQAGLRRFDAAAFTKISERFDNDPYYDEPLPRTEEEEFAYAAKAEDLQRRQQAEESELASILTFHFLALKPRHAG